MGQALVEFAIVLPVLMLILVMAVDMGRIFLGWIALNNSVRVGANYAAMNADAWGAMPDADKQAKYLVLLEADTAGLNCTRGSIPAPDFLAGTEIGMPVRVELICTFDFITPLVGNLFGGSLTMSAQAVFPVRTGVVAGAAAAAPPVINSVTTDPAMIGTPPTITGTVPIAVSFLADTDNAVAWVWNFGDGSPLATDGEAETYTYTTPGTYDVTVVAYNVASVATSPYHVGKVVVLPPPDDNAAFTVSPGVTGMVPFVVTFKDASSPTPVSWKWDFGDGQTDTIQNPPAHTYAAVGTYHVTLQVKFPDGVVKDAPPVDITVTTATKMCTVPPLTGKLTSKVEGIWTTAGFKKPVQYNPMPLNGYKVTAQYDGSAGGAVVPLPAGASRPCDTQVVIVTSGK